MYNNIYEENGIGSQIDDPDISNALNIHQHITKMELFSLRSTSEL